MARRGRTQAATSDSARVRFRSAQESSRLPILFSTRKTVCRLTWFSLWDVWR
jgi:hypothetical protein